MRILETKFQTELDFKPIIAVMLMASFALLPMTKLIIF